MARRWGRGGVKVIKQGGNPVQKKKKKTKNPGYGPSRIKKNPVQLHVIKHKRPFRSVFQENVLGPALEGKEIEKQLMYPAQKGGLNFLVHLREKL